MFQREQSKAAASHDPSCRLGIGGANDRHFDRELRWQMAVLVIAEASHGGSSTSGFGRLCGEGSKSGKDDWYGLDCVDL